MDEASLKNLFLREFERSTRGVFDRATEVIFAGENSDFIKDKAAELIDVYRTHKPSISYEKDVYEFLKGLRARGLKSAVITDGNSTTQRNKLKAVGAFDDFDEIVITSEHGSDWVKPSVKAFLHIAQHFCVRPDEIVYIGDNVRIGDGCQIYPNSVIEDNVSLGDNCLIYANVSIYHDCKIGNNVTIHSGSVIGADGFGFAPNQDGYDKIPQIGIVKIEDNVEIGANSCVDRSTMGQTIIRKGVKIDNLVQVAHNVEIGENTVMSAQVGIAGSTKVGSWCMFGGQVGLAGHITVGDKTFLGAQSGVPGNIKGNEKLIGTPPMEPHKYFKSQAIFRKLPELYKQIAELQKQVDELKKK